jgi:hypothetical protein
MKPEAQPMEIWNNVESFTKNHEVMVRCRVCGEVLSRISLQERLMDQNFPRHAHQIGLRHLPACSGQEQNVNNSIAGLAVAVLPNQAKAIRIGS